MDVGLDPMLIPAFCLPYKEMTTCSFLFSTARFIFFIFILFDLLKQQSCENNILIRKTNEKEKKKKRKKDTSVLIILLQMKTYVNESLKINKTDQLTNESQSL